MLFQKILQNVRSSSTRSTIDPRQIELFENLSKEWWPQCGTLRILHALNGIRVPWLQSSLMKIGTINPDFDKSTPLAGISILDVGCGGGIFAEPLSRLGGNVTGIDCNPQMLQLANSRKETEKLDNLKYLHSTIEEHVIDNTEKYDVVVASETIEHVLEQDFFVECCVKCLKPGGSFFVTTNTKSLISKFLFITVLEDIIRRLPKGTHRYDMFIDVEDLKKMLKNENCETIFTSGIMYNPLRNTWFWIKNQYILHYALHAVKQ